MSWPIPIRHFLRTRIYWPLLQLLRIGATPTQLAWSLAVGIAIGLNPVLGTTTVLCLVTALLFRLNVVASQIGNHIVFPLQVMLVFAYLRAGEVVFRTGHLQLTPADLRSAMQHRQWEKVRVLWTWQWHAIVVWLIAAAILTPIAAAALRPLLERLLLRVQHPRT